jgi:glutamine synthetase
VKINKPDIKDIIKIVDAERINFIKLCFVDILGQLKAFTITRKELEHALNEGMGFDGSSIEGFARIYESDLLLMPDIKTFNILPESFDGSKTAIMFGDILTPDGKNYEGDTRFILKKNIEYMKGMGYTNFMVGPELEYFYFKDSTKPEIIDDGSYFDSVPVDESSDLRKKTIQVLDEMNIHVEYSHHEVAPSQHEIDLRYNDALSMADNVLIYKLVVKEVASKNNVYATFMPKPLNGENGSGMHVHQSLFKNNKNMFFDKKDDYFLSQDAKYYIAGLMNHVREICLVTNQWVNSYKRLVPGYEAPVYIAWARRNRSVLIRVPQAKPGKEESTRIEARFPDPATNPYLCFAVMLRAGLDGIKNKLSLKKPVEADIYEMNEIERRANRIDVLPGSLIEAIDEAKNSKILKETLGEHVYEKLIENKNIEWDMYRIKVSDYEIKRYFSIL